MAALLVSAEELIDDVAHAPVPVIIDVRWSLTAPEGIFAYYTGHIPGAVFADLDNELSGTPSRKNGRHPLPDIQALQANARRWGISEDSRVVVCDDTGGAAAARAWWLLKWAGIADVKILDGGVQAWRRAGGDLASGPGNIVVHPGNVTLSAGHMPTVSIEEVAERDEQVVLLDARGPERFRGEMEPIDRQAGHIPGAVNTPLTDNLDELKRFKSADALQAHFERFGVRFDAPDAAAPIVYCGSGVSAAHVIAALELAGLPGARLYPGSWSQWSGDRGRPISRGDERQKSTAS